MKKTLSLVLMLVMAITLFAGCSDPIADDFANFLNIEMTGVNENYTKITTEAATWATFEELSQMETSINDVMLPLVNDSLEKLEAIEPATEEVKEIKAKYVKVMEAYKEGFNLVLEGTRAEDVNKVNAGNEKINEGVTLLNEYNEALEALAEQTGSEIQY
ncbi:MAG: hypothetical protein IKM21_00715 [Oscillospiraceae bacterium]|nr:hypothetical protein [Oscillospiraceae bacterium]